MKTLFLSVPRERSERPGVIGLRCAVEEKINEVLSRDSDLDLELTSRDGRVLAEEIGQVLKFYRVGDFAIRLGLYTGSTAQRIIEVLHAGSDLRSRQAAVLLGCISDEIGFSKRMLRAVGREIDGQWITRNPGPVGNFIVNIVVADRKDTDWEMMATCITDGLLGGVRAAMAME